MSRRRWAIGIGIVLAMFAAVVTTSILLPTSADRLPWSVTNPRPNGVMALAQVLGSQGVQVRQVTSLDAAVQAPAGSTLAVTINDELTEAAVSRLQAARADLVIFYAAKAPVDSVAELSDGKIGTTYWWREKNEPPLGCTDEDARAAGRISASNLGLYAIGNNVRPCFLDASGNGLYATVDAPGHRIAVIAGSSWIRNDTITDYGNAALALRVLGRHAQLTWYLPGADALVQNGADKQIDPYSLLPGWFWPTGALLVVTLAAAALWRGRRFGPLVAERLPVAMPASEVSSGLARLYRQAAARGHAAAALRAASLHRLGARLGLPTAAAADLVVERLARASGEAPALIRTLYYGPPPDTDSDLVALGAQLTDLEAKVTSHE